ncbi:MAG: serine/threonine-protein kinase [Actinomycetota bacterium]
MKAGERIQDRYTLTEPLGSGGMAEVWCAHDERLERDVAIKFLRSNLASEPEFLVRFFSEAQCVARISHPNVVAVLDFGRFEEAPYLVMELVPGGALSELAGPPLAPERAVDLVMEAARGAGAAHEVGLVHRDIKPGNILVDEEGSAKITDFGIASSRVHETLTATGTAIGSPHYISAEQVSGTTPTPRSDVYSLGVVLYELLTGVKPFDGDNVTAIAISHVDREPEPPSAHDPDIDSQLDALVMRCLSKDPAERFENGEVLAVALEDLRSGAPVLVPSAPLLSPEDTLLGPEPVVPGVRGSRRRLLVGGTIVALLGAGGVAMVFAGDPDEPRVAASVPGPESSETPKEPRDSPTPDNAVGTAPVVAESTPPASPTPSETPAEQRSNARTGETRDEGSQDPEGEPTEEPTEEPSEEPTEEPSPEETPDTAGSPEGSTEEGNSSES